MSATIAVENLQVGMFIHLDLGWWAHPFALSSFKLQTDEQIAQVRALGLREVRWSPDKSDLSAANVLPLRPAPPAAEPPPAPAEAAAAAGDARTQAERDQAQALAEQRHAAQVCERQYAEARQAWRQAHAHAQTEPDLARQVSQGLAQALASKMLGSSELSIRVLAEPAGDRASAHALNVGVLSMLMGRSLGLADAELQELGLGALLHDIGKLTLPDRLQHADPQASAHEQSAYRDHVAQGVVLGKRMGLAPGTLLILAQHHELADGSGFPQGLNKERMGLASRVVSLVNRYDNLCNPRLASQALTPHEALSLIFAQGRDKFDATLLNTFIRMMGVYPPGSAVQLTDNRYALVMTVNSSRPLKPRVLVHEPTVPPEQALHLDLENQPDLGIRRSLKLHQLPAATVQYLAPRERVAYFFEPALRLAGNSLGGLAA
ncbi:uncharacterized domain HDIG-containing protein [Burkholderiales bacterium JOSHI_001]|nr:uncharacterized domain HDIG-containing protein [Burkholderiales bacterium JOSHI_001]